VADAHADHAPLAAPPRMSLRERFAAWRNRLLASPAFQAFAARAPVFRTIANARARDLFVMATAYVQSQTLIACVRTGLFRALADGPLDVPAIARATGLPLVGADRLVRAAEALKLLERFDDRYGLGELGASVLGNPGVAEIITHHAILYRDLADPVAMLKAPRGSGELGAYWAYAGAAAPEASAADAVAPYSGLMAATQAWVARHVLDAWPVARHRAILDVGGGEGAFLAAAGAEAPHLALHLFDLPAVTARARDRLTAAGLIDRTTLHPGSFRSDPLPKGCDLISFVRVLHDHDDNVVRQLLAKARAAIAPGGVVLIAEPMAAEPGAEAIGEAYFGFYLHAMGSGRPRTPDAYAALLAEAGFTRITRKATAAPVLVRVVAARA
jgi:demethylspheroidene O-methyltransferase